MVIDEGKSVGMPLRKERAADQAVERLVADRER
jgi:hypothetical protein